MAYYRRNYRRNYRRRQGYNGYGRPNRYRKRYSRARVPRTKLTDNTPYRFKRTVQFPAVTSSVGASYGALTFSLAQLTNPTEFTSLFDSFKISGIKLVFMPRISESNGPAGSQGFGTFIYSPDYDDGTVPSSSIELLERQSHRVKQIGSTRPFKIFLKPSAGVTLVGGFGQTKGWSDTANNGILYYGLKYAWTNVVVSSIMDLYVTYYLKFKGVK